MTKMPVPIYLGRLEPIRAGDVVDRFIEIRSPELAADETIEDAVFTVTDANGAVVAGVVTAYTCAAHRCDFRITAPATTGKYNGSVTFTIDDGQLITKTFEMTIS